MASHALLLAVLATDARPTLRTTLQEIRALTTGLPGDDAPSDLVRWSLSDDLTRSVEIFVGVNPNLGAGLRVETRLPPPCRLVEFGGAPLTRVQMLAYLRTWARHCGASRVWTLRPGDPTSSPLTRFEDA